MKLIEVNAMTWFFFNLEKKCMEQKIISHFKIPLGQVLMDLVKI